MSSALAVLAAPRCLDAARNATLHIVESLLDLEGPWGQQIIMSHVDQLLGSLKTIAITAWTVPVSCPCVLCFCAILAQLHSGGQFLPCKSPRSSLVHEHHQLKSSSQRTSCRCARAIMASL